MQIVDAKWVELQDKVIGIVDRQDDTKVKLKGYAQTYARHILANLDEAKAFGLPFEDATKTQLLYVISNLRGADETDLGELQKLAEDVGVDVSFAIREIKGELDYDDED